MPCAEQPVRTRFTAAPLRPRLPLPDGCQRARCRAAQMRIADRCGWSPCGTASAAPHHAAEDETAVYDIVDTQRADT